MKPSLVQQYISEFARRNPSKIAATDGKDIISYRDLEIASNRLAHCLIDKGVSRQDRVTFCIKRSVNCLIAMLAIMKADAIYVPIDQKTPEERLKKIIADCTPSAVICDKSTISRIAKVTKTPHLDKMIISMRDQNRHKENAHNIVFHEQICNYSKDQPEYKNCETDTAYVLYTSGSTGSPKGVMISHQNIHSYINWAVEYFHITKNDKILGTAPFHFDMSIFDIFGAFKAGATLCIAEENSLIFPEMLMQFMEKEKVTIWKGVSSLLMYLERAGVLGKDRIPTLGKILFAGESLSVKYLSRWMETYPDKKFYNAYGPTEATGISLCYMVEAIPQNGKEKTPIGKPCKDTKVFLINDDDTLVEPGQVGELCVSGACLSKGYLNDQEKTDRSFVQNPFADNSGEKIYRTGDLALLKSDGNYVFVARKDSQVKYMGYRIELCEIEHALGAISSVKDGAVLLRESDNKGLNELVAFYETDKDITSVEIISELQLHLPHYMIPKQLIKVDCIPRNDRGKICRISLQSNNFSEKSSTA